MAGYHRLKDFVDDFGIETPLFKFACQPDCSADECQGCQGFELVDKVVDQIADAGVEFMKSLQKDWINSHK